MRADDPQPLEPVSIEASLTESGVSIQSQSRFVSAIDRLFGGLFAWPAAYVDGRISKKNLQDEIERREIEAKADLRLQGELKAEELRIAIDYMRQRKEAESVLNLSAVATLALEDLREKTGPDGDAKSDEPISDDWLNWFRNFSEKASSDEVRRLWAKILAGETRKPGRFSVGTLRTLAEVDHQLATLFQKHVNHLFWNEYIIKNDKVKGVELLELADLEDAGLLREVNGLMGFNQTFSPAGKLDFEQNGVILELEAAEGTSFRISVIRLSRAGRELFSILPKPDPAMAFRRLVELLPEEITSAKLGFVVERLGSDEYRWTTTEVLR
jgi:hypothetical protein